MNQENKEKQFKCRFCSKSFKTSSGRTQHERGGHAELYHELVAAGRDKEYAAIQPPVMRALPLQEDAELTRDDRVSRLVSFGRLNTEIEEFVADILSKEAKLSEEPEEGPEDLL